MLCNETFKPGGALFTDDDLEIFHVSLRGIANKEKNDIRKSLYKAKINHISMVTVLHNIISKTKDQFFLRLISGKIFWKK